MKNTTTALLLFALVLMFTSFKNKNLDIKKCQYYSYVVYGEAMTNGKLNKLEPVYKGFKMYKSTESFFACFDVYKRTKSGKFTIINIGPYDTESVIYQEINRTREDLVSKGYNKAINSKHTFPANFIYDNKPCK